MYIPTTTRIGIRTVATGFLLAAAPLACTKKAATSSAGVFSCSFKKGNTQESCTEFKNLTSNEVVYFKQKCDSDSALGSSLWQEAPCATDARQGGCEVTYTDSATNISAQTTRWGYTAAALSYITSPASCEEANGRIVNP
jgi:hypothetical protein